MVLYTYRVFFLVFILFISKYAFSQCPDDPSFNYNGGQLNFDQLDANVLPTVASSGGTFTATKTGGMYQNSQGLQWRPDGGNFLSIDAATNAGLRELGKKMNTRLASKTKETVRQANIGEKVSSKTEMNRISTIVVKEVTVKGYEVVETKMVSLDNGNYRTFILLKYQIGLAYKNYIDQLKKSDVLKADFKKIENTQAFKELELYVSEFSGA